MVRYEWRSIQTPALKSTKASPPLSIVSATMLAARRPRPRLIMSVALSERVPKRSPPGPIAS